MLRWSRWAGSDKVVGVFLNLAIWFGLHVIFAEVAERQLLKVLGGCALLGIHLSLAL